MKLSHLAAVMLVLLGASGANAGEPWRFGVVEAKGDAGILFMPARFGAKYGLDIEMVQFASSNTPIKALIAGELEAFTASPGVALTAMSRGARLKFIGCNWPGATYTLYGAPDVKTVADLKGKSIGVSGPGSMPDLFVRVVLDQSGVQPGQVVFANSGGGSDRFRALLAGVVKATATSSEFEPEAQKRGLTILARANHATPNFARNCIVTTDKILATRGDAAARFLAATMDGTAYAMSHRDATVALSRQAADLAPGDSSPEFIFDEALAHHDTDATLAIPADKLQWIEAVLAKSDTIDDAVPVKAFIDDAPRQSALKLLRP